MIADRDDYTYTVETIKKNVKNKDVQKALLRAAATNEDTIIFWFDWESLEVFDSWEEAVQIANMPTRFSIAYLEGYYLRVAYYGWQELSTMGLGGYDFKATLFDALTGSKKGRIHLSELESELEKLFKEGQEAVLAETIDEEEITY